jgi:hypothetical protein
MRFASANELEDWQRMQPITPRGYVCGYTAEPVQIDGRLDEQAWEAAPWTADFVDIEGSAKPRPKYRTRAKLLWDNENLYLGAELEEPHVSATIKDHDAVIFQDNDFEVFLNPDGNNHNYYELELNALNTTWDLFLNRPYKDGGTADNAWEFAGMKTAVHVAGTLNDPRDQDHGWTVEIAIPWRAFSRSVRPATPPQAGDAWRLDFSRVEWQYDVVEGKYRKVPNQPENNWVWSPQGIIDMHRPERWGYVQFTKRAAKDVAFVPDPTLPSRDLLMEVYHHQKDYFAAHQKYAGSLAELHLGPLDASLSKSLRLTPTAEGYLAQVDLPSGAKEKGPLTVRQDSLVSAEPDPLAEALKRAGKNRPELEQALAKAPADQQPGLRFLILNMPDRDLHDLSAAYLLENLKLAYQAWNESPWKKDIPEAIFFNDILPYANINERRDDWRKEFYEKFHPLVKDAKTAAQAGAILNQKVFPLVKVKYSTQRPKADQSATESIKAGLASCTGLSVLLIDACRSVGVPARFVGTPLWTDNSGNHSWVEIWDHGWHFTGAAEPTGDKLDEAWFVNRASTAKRDDARNAIYAVSFRKTPLAFPFVWDPDIKYVSAVNVTDRYVGRGKKPPEGMIEVAFKTVDAQGRRQATPLKIIDDAGHVAFAGTTNDERFDANDHLSTYLLPGQRYQVELGSGTAKRNETFKPERRDGPYTWTVDAPAKGSK